MMNLIVIILMKCSMLLVWFLLSMLERLEEEGRELVDAPVKSIWCKLAMVIGVLISLQWRRAPRKWRCFSNWSRGVFWNSGGWDRGGKAIKKAIHFLVDIRSSYLQGTNASIKTNIAFALLVDFCNNDIKMMVNRCCGISDCCWVHRCMRSWINCGNGSRSQVRNSTTPFWQSNWTLIRGGGIHYSL